MIHIMPVKRISKYIYRMISVRYLKILFILLGCCFSVSWSVVAPTREVWIVQHTSHLRVDGKTNVNQFNCVVPDYSGTDSLVCILPLSGGDVCRATGSMQIPISAFDCHHRMMTKDLQKTLRMEEHPVMRIDFKNFPQLPSKLNKGASLTANAEISLAGVTRRYNLNFAVKNVIGQTLDLKATQPILFSDFKLIPPSKLGGTIRVKDELEVMVSLQLKRQR